MKVKINQSISQSISHKINQSVFILRHRCTSNLSKTHETRDSLSSSYSQVVLI